MPTPSPELRLFGLDLSVAGQEISRAWRKLLCLPLFAWLGPRPQVLLHEANGGLGVWEACDAMSFSRRGAAADKRAVFHAVEIPEDIVLRKRLTLPSLNSEQLAHAVGLEVQGGSPFPHADTVWGFRAKQVEGRAGKVSVELALASRRLIDKYLSTRSLGPSSVPPEVWVRNEDRTAAYVLRGFGEGRRLRAERRGWAFLAGFVLLSTLLLVAIGLTPTLQLRERALQAVAASDQLVKQTRPQVAKREALLAAEGRMQALSAIVGNRLNPMQAMHTLTNVLGDDTSLQRLQIEGRNVLIAGQTPDTAAMMQRLSATSGFKGVRAPSAATRPAGATKETFLVEFTIDEETAPAASAKPVASEARP